jgi:isopropylmalate/homocitrate/citramalate synthase
MPTVEDKTGPWVSDEYWVSPFNFEPSVTSRPSMPERIIIHDTTLRDGAQTPGVVFRAEDKIAVAKLLDDAGCDRIELGMPAVSQDEKDAIRAVAELGLKADLYCACPAGRKESEIDFAAEIGLTGITTRIPAGMPRFKYHFPDWSEDDVIRIGTRAVAYAKEKGLRVALSLLDVSRAEKPFLERVLNGICKNVRPDELTVLDTSGCLIPRAAACLVTFLKELTGIPIAIHTHNDVGLGLANTLAAIEAGAEVVHVCVNAIGERGGNVALEELVVVLECFYGRKQRIDTHGLTALSREIERISNVPIPWKKPIVGDGIYCRESGLGLHLVKDEPLAIFSLLPELTGQRSQVALGKGSGLDSVDLKLGQLGIIGMTDREQKKAVLGKIKDRAYAKKGLVNDDEFREIVASVLKGA